MEQGERQNLLAPRSPPPTPRFICPRKDSNFHCPRSKRGDSCQLVYVGSRQALSTRFEPAIFSVTGRRELQASPREHSVGDDRIELPSSRCKRDVIPFHQSPAANPPSSGAGIRTPSNSFRASRAASTLHRGRSCQLLAVSHQPEVGQLLTCLAES